MSIPPTAPPKPPIPTTEPTARRGNMSDARVKMLADQPWWAAAARPMSPTAAHSEVTWVANTIGITHRAQTSMVVLRAALIDQPHLIR